MQPFPSGCLAQLIKRVHSGNLRGWQIKTPAALLVKFCRDTVASPNLAFEECARPRAQQRDLSSRLFFFNRWHFRTSLRPRTAALRKGKIKPGHYRRRYSTIAILHPLERLKKYCSRLERGFLVFWRGFRKGAGLKKPVTEPKRSQKPKRPLCHYLRPNGYSIFENALNNNGGISHHPQWAFYLHRKTQNPLCPGLVFSILRNTLCS